MGFDEWLARAYPDARLTPMQSEFVERYLSANPGEVVMWSGGRASGRRFVLRLVDEFRNAPDVK